MGAKRGKRFPFDRDDIAALDRALQDPDLTARLVRVTKRTVGQLRRVVRGDTPSAPWRDAARAVMKVATGKPPYTPDEEMAVRLYRRAKYAQPEERDAILGKLLEIATVCEAAFQQSSTTTEAKRRVLDAPPAPPPDSES